MGRWGGQGGQIPLSTVNSQQSTATPLIPNFYEETTFKWGI
ncbi:hypothetical protein [Nostoc linckia]|nr:hypothetical protein [Nostoc linckia]